MGKFVIYKDKNGEYRFRLQASNGEIILVSEGYSSKRAVERGIESVKRNSKVTESFVRKVSKDGRYYFVLKATNGQIIGKSSFYISRTGLEGGIKAVKESKIKVEESK